MVVSTDAQVRDKAEAVPLLDEPSHYLHSKSQGDRLRHLENDCRNQMIYTAQSPLIVPTHYLKWVRTVTISTDAGTTVTKNPTGNTRSLVPL